MKRTPINTDGDCAKTILAGYYKYGVATLLGGRSERQGLRYLRCMKKRVIPMNVTDEGCAFAIVTRYEGRAYLKSMTSGGGIIQQQEYWKCGRKSQLLTGRNHLPKKCSRPLSHKRTRQLP